jgi:hypothetical protein
MINLFRVCFDNVFYSISFICIIEACFWMINLFRVFLIMFFILLALFVLLRLVFGWKKFYFLNFQLFFALFFG